MLLRKGVPYAAATDIQHQCIAGRVQIGSLDSPRFRICNVNSGQRPAVYCRGEILFPKRTLCPIVVLHLAHLIALATGARRSRRNPGTVLFLWSSERAAIHSRATSEPSKGPRYVHVGIIIA